MQCDVVKKHTARVWRVGCLEGASSIRTGGNETCIDVIEQFARLHNKAIAVAKMG